MKAMGPCASRHCAGLGTRAPLSKGMGLVENTYLSCAMLPGLHVVAGGIVEVSPARDHAESKTIYVSPTTYELFSFAAKRAE